MTKDLTKNYNTHISFIPFLNVRETEKMTL